MISARDKPTDKGGMPSHERKKKKRKKLFLFQKERKKKGKREVFPGLA